MKDTSISWTHHTFNPWWGCEKISPACAHCYAETFAKRTGWAEGSPSGNPPLWGKSSQRRFFGEKHWNQPLKWDAEAAEAGERHRVFCASMADVFENRIDLVPHRALLFDLIRRTPNLDWLLLTKRPENVRRHIAIALESYPVCSLDSVNPTFKMLASWESGNPPANVWIGTTVENQEQADKRIPELLKIPARIRFLSCEPLLGPVDLRKWLRDDRYGKYALPAFDWAICGGESGANARPMHPDWARNLRDQCAAADVPFHFKQWGEYVTAAPIKRGAFDFSGAKTMANDGTIYEPGDLAFPDGARYGEAIRKNHERAGLTNIYRVGTRAAGRLLDGVLHDTFPKL